MWKWLLRGRAGIAVALIGAFLTLSLCPSECLATADGRSTAVPADCHDADPAQRNDRAGHDLICCDPSVALGARPGADAAALEPHTVLLVPLPVTVLAVRPLGAGASHLATARHGPEPFRARSPILRI